MKHICKNCGHHITEMFKEEGFKWNKQQYSHFCYSNHNPLGNRQQPGHADKECCVCGCTNPEPKEALIENLKMEVDQNE